MPNATRTHVNINLASLETYRVFVIRQRELENYMLNESPYTLRFGINMIPNCLRKMECHHMGVVLYKQYGHDMVQWTVAECKDTAEAVKLLAREIQKVEGDWYIESI